MTAQAKSHADLMTQILDVFVNEWRLLIDLRRRGVDSGTIRQRIRSHHGAGFANLLELCDTQIADAAARILAAGSGVKQ